MLSLCAINPLQDYRVDAAKNVNQRRLLVLKNFLVQMSNRVLVCTLELLLKIWDTLTKVRNVLWILWSSYEWDAFLQYQKGLVQVYISHLLQGFVAIFIEFALGRRFEHDLNVDRFWFLALLVNGYFTLSIIDLGGQNVGTSLSAKQKYERVQWKLPLKISIYGRNYSKKERRC